MIETCPFSNRGNIFYYDIEKKVIARFPSKSNLLSKGSDNSLYFGTNKNENIVKIFCKLFDVKKIDEISNLNYDMKSGNDNVNVILNLNFEGQIQIKIMKDGTMSRLSQNFAFRKMKQYDFTKMLIVIDFNNREIRFKDPNELSL